MKMYDFIYPEGAEQFDAAAFNQDRTFIMAGNREECEQAAINARGLYCWWVSGKPVIKGDFEGCHAHKDYLFAYFLY
jgi:hypothetical protein